MRRMVADQRLALGTAVVLSLAAVASVSAHNGYGPPHYNAPCNTGNSSYLQQEYLDPFAHNNPGTYTYAASTVTVRNLYQCTSPNATYYGFSLVNAVSLQNHPQYLVQFGYGVCAQITCQHGFPSTENVEEFWWTQNANGDIYAATWVDFNNDGIHDKPVVGRSYT